MALKIVLKFKNMKAIELTFGAGVMGTNYTHYSDKILTPGEVLFTREGKKVSVISFSDENEMTSLTPMPAYKCRIEGINESAMVYDAEMLEHLNR